MPATSRAAPKRPRKPPPEAKPKGKAERSPRPRKPPEPTRPHGRLGLAWAAATFLAAGAGRPVLALWLAPQAALAAAQLARAQRPGRATGTAAPVLPVAAGGAAALCLAAAVGLWAVTAVVCAVPLVAAALPAHRTSPADRALGSFTVTTVVGAAAASVVLVAGRGFTEAAVLLLLVGAYDAGAYLVGTGATNRWEGPIAGIAAVLAVDLSVAAILVPPFRGASAWVAGLAVAAAAPAGVALARGLTQTAPASTRLSALRRLDSLLVAGPAYAGVVAVML